MQGGFIVCNAIATGQGQGAIRKFSFDRRRIREIQEILASDITLGNRHCGT